MQNALSEGQDHALVATLTKPFLCSFQKHMKYHLAHWGLLKSIGVFPMTVGGMDTQGRTIRSHLNLLKQEPQQIEPIKTFALPYKLL